MIIGFDATWMDLKNISGGVFQYAFRLISAIVQHTDAKVVIIIKGGGKGIFDHLKGKDNFEEVLLKYPITFQKVVKLYNIDVVHTPIQYLPNLTCSVPMITTLHDLQHFYYPEFFTLDEITFRNTLYRYSAEFAEKVIVSFQHVKDDIVRFYGVPSKRIDVCPIGAILPKPLDSNRLQEIRIKYGLKGKYLFYSANTWRHKNHINLIMALRILHEKYGIKIPLVCTGQRYPDYYPELESAINKLNLNDAVKFTGYIPEEDVRLLLKNSTLAVIPTIYEAGSFPLMEAMAYEVPVICSNVTSLPETIGDQRFVFNPKDIEQIAGKIAMILTDERLRKENIENSINRVGKGGWDKTVFSFLSTYSEAIDSFRDNTARLYLNSRIQKYKLLRRKLYEHRIRIVVKAMSIKSVVKYLKNKKLSSNVHYA